MKPTGLLLAALVALQPLILGGCVAAVVPVVAGSMIAKTRMDGKQDGTVKGEHRREARAVDSRSPSEQRRDERRAGKRDRLAAKPPAQQVEVPAATEPLPQRIRPIDEADIPKEARIPGVGTAVQLTGLTALPPPGGASGTADGGFPAFVRFAQAAAQPRPGHPFRSALIDPASLTTRPSRPLCGTQPPAVLIDLDPGKAAFDLDDPPAAAPGLAEQLAALRAGGLTVLWQASLPADQAERLYAILAATGLDPDRTDRLLLIRKAGERKQARRQAAARDWCIVALAGDSKGDFDEAFDYLRDPNGTIAAALSANLGDGWFLTPPPIH